MTASASSTEKPGVIDDDDLLAQLAEAEMEQDALLGSTKAEDTHADISGLSGSERIPSSAVPGDGIFSGGEKAVRNADDGGKSGATAVPMEEMIEFGISPGAPSTAKASRKDGGGCDSPASKDQPDPPSQPTAVVLPPTSSEADGGINEDAASKTAADSKVKGASGSFKDELSQLEELERELGIMGIGGKDGVDLTTPKGGVAKAKPGAGSEASKVDAFDMDNLDELEGYLESLAK